VALGFNILDSKGKLEFQMFKDLDQAFRAGKLPSLIEGCVQIMCPNPWSLKPGVPLFLLYIVESSSSWTPRYATQCEIQFCGRLHAMRHCAESTQIHDISAKSKPNSKIF
jgi:hypothetical protein